MKGFRLPLFAWCLGFFLVLPLDARSADTGTDNRYGITMVSSVQPIRADEMPAAEILSKYHVYITQFTKGNQVWYRLRVGFFDGYSKAKSFLPEIRKYYHDAWINRVSDSEYTLALTNRIGSKEQNKSAVKPQSQDKECQASSTTRRHRR